ncbi:hypothetical protein [Helicobacter sp. 23-1046]
MDSIINFASAFGGVIGGWLITHIYHKITQQDTRKQRIKDKMEKLLEAIQFAYKSNGITRKNKLQYIVYINIRDRRDLLGSKLVAELEDLLFKNSDDKDSVIVDIRQLFKKYYPKYFE